MDQVRRIRFLISPLIFVASLLWGVRFDPCAWQRLLHLMNGSDAGLVSKIVLAGSAILAAGYVFGTLTYVVLHVVYRLASKSHEMPLGEPALLAIWEYLGRSAPLEEIKAKSLYAGVAFDYGFVAQEFPAVHDWIARRWTGFAVAATSITGILCSFAAGWVFHVRWTAAWLLPWLVFIAMLVYVAYVSRRDVRAMLTFMAEKPRLSAPRRKSANSQK